MSEFDSRSPQHALMSPTETIVRNMTRHDVVRYGTQVPTRQYVLAALCPRKSRLPAIETLEKIARAIELPTYQLFYEMDKVPQTVKVSTNGEWIGLPTDREARVFRKIRQAVVRMSENDRALTGSDGGKDGQGQEVAGGPKNYLLQARVPVKETRFR